MALRDQTGREIRDLDMLRVFHFVGARRKRHYLYKQAVGYVVLKDRSEWLRISHLNREGDDPWSVGENCYLERADGRCLSGVEIVQSADADFEQRPKVT